MNAPTRADYLAKHCTHDEFYLAVAKTAGIVFQPDWPFTVRVRKALADGDEHLNTIPLREWDERALWLESPLSSALRAHGDVYCAATATCVLKAAARAAVLG